MINIKETPFEFSYLKLVFGMFQVFLFDLAFIDETDSRTYENTPHTQKERYWNTWYNKCLDLVSESMSTL